MVFSQTSQKTLSILNVVEIDRLNPGKDQKENGVTGVVIESKVKTAPTSPMASPTPTTSFSEEYLKPEPLFETMFHEDSEYFQDLDQYIFASTKEEQLPIIGPSRNEEHKIIHNTVTYTPISPSGWETHNASSPYAQLGFYNATPTNLSPTLNEIGHIDSKFQYNLLPENEKSIQFQGQDLDINSLPIVFGDISTEYVDINSLQTSNSIDWNDTHTHNITYNDGHFIHDDTVSSNLTDCVSPLQVENNVTISEFIINESTNGYEKKRYNHGKELTLDVSAAVTGWPSDVIVSTPDVLKCVEQLEKNDDFVDLEACERASLEFRSELVHEPALLQPAAMDSTPHTPKTESDAESDEEYSYPKKRRRQHRDESDESYTPTTDRASPRKYKRRKPNVPIKDMIIALEGSQQLTKTRRGRPPKRRDSTVSSVCSDNASTTSHGSKYRELRDKNNEASKRSRMNRKLKELQMEQMALELEEKNKKLMIKAESLEKITKQLRDAFMATIIMNK